MPASRITRREPNLLGEFHFPQKKRKNSAQISNDGAAGDAGPFPGWKSTVIERVARSLVNPSGTDFSL